MTDKEQIMINGVNVRGCKYRSPGGFFPDEYCRLNELQYILQR